MCSVLFGAEENDADAAEEAHAKRSSTLLNTALEIFYPVVSVFHCDDGHDHSERQRGAITIVLWWLFFLRIDSRAGRLPESFIT